MKHSSAGQLLLVGVPGTELDSETAALFRRVQPGGFILFGRNITNQIRAVGGIDFNNLTGFINEPRTWGVQFKAQF